MAVLAAGRAGLVVLLGIDCDGGGRVMEEQDWHGVLLLLVFQTVSPMADTITLNCTSHPPLDLCTTPQDVAAYIKKEFDKKYNPTWHCIVGRNFGSYVTHETKHFIYFYLGQVAVLLFKSG